jgi:hypothetical protein
MENHGGMILKGEKRRTWRKLCLRATLSTTNPTYTDPGANQGLRDDRPAINRLITVVIKAIYAYFHSFLNCPFIA